MKFTRAVIFGENQMWHLLVSLKVISNTCLGYPYPSLLQGRIFLKVAKRRWYLPTKLVIFVTIDGA